MKKYLYLSEKWHCEAWVNGGEIPIKIASTYLSNKRNGILTPDENLIHKGEYPVPSLMKFGIYIQEVKSLTITDSTSGTQRIPDIIDASYYKEDGLILSFCNVFDPEIAKRMGKVACVEIKDMDTLKDIISEQLSCDVIADYCKYTKSHERNHFLKSVNDKWQQEYRLFWKLLENKNVTLPPGIARVVPLPEK